MIHRTAGPASSSLRELFRTQIDSQGSAPAYVFLGNDLEPSQVLTYEDLGRSAQALARQIGALTRPGDRVLLAFSNDPSAVLAFWSCLLAGVVPVPAPAPDMQAPKGDGNSRLLGIATDAGSTLALTQLETLDAARAQAPSLSWHAVQNLLANVGSPADHVSPDATPLTTRALDPQLAYLQYTSGSTSAPRGVEITHAAALNQCRALTHCLTTESPRGLIWLPWFHDYGLVHGVILSMYLGCTSYLMPTSSFVLRPLRWLEAVDRYAITHTGAPDFAYAACVQAMSRAGAWNARLDTLQLATCGAEPIRAATLDSFTSAFAPFGLRSTALAPSYGLAEAVLAVTVREPRASTRVQAFDSSGIERLEVIARAPGTPGSRSLVGCGAALPGFRLAIVDPDTATECPPGRIGEIWLSGASVGRGYWGQPDATEEIFGARLAGQNAESPRYLRTGDLGFLHEGELFIAGRRKDLIIVNGRNLYPQDLEQSAEAAHPNVRRGGVMAVSMARGGKESAALLVECAGKRTPDVVATLVAQVSQQVASEHQIDLIDIVALRPGTLPRTSSGKLQRQAAGRLYRQGRFEPLRLASGMAQTAMYAEGAEPDAALIDKLGRLWAEVLGLDVVDPEANFFELGGDSLLATQLVSRVAARLGIDLPISALFESPTLLGLARRVANTPYRVIAEQASSVVSAPVSASPRAAGSTTPLSFSQERMWFMHHLAPEAGAYNIPLALRLRGALDVTSMQNALARLVARHEILRTRFCSTSEGPVAEVVPAFAPRLEIVPANGEPAQAMAKEELHQHLAAFSKRPFQLDRDPLIRACVIRLAQDEAVLLIVLHHIVGDQWSFVELGRELATHYNACKADQETALPALPLQYADYAQWHRSWFTQERHARERAHWTERLKGLEPLVLNEDHVRPRRPSFEGASLRLPLDKARIAALRGIGAAHGASLSMVLIAALKILLLRHTARTDIAIGVPIANRQHLASESLIGTFVNTLVYRTDLQGNPDFLTVLARVRDVSLQAFAHQDMPFELLVRELGGQQDAGRPPLFNVMFNMVNAQVRDCHFDGLTWRREDFDRQSTQFDLTVVADMLYDESIVLEYATDLFAPSTVVRMGEHLLQILNAVVTSPTANVGDLPMLSDGEQEQLRRWSQGPAESLAIPTVADWAAQGARTAPDHTALVFETERWSHRQLEQAANRLARVLRHHGASRGHRIGVCLPRGQALVMALLGILKTGAAYVPLDPDYPAERLNQQMQDAGLSLLVTTAALADTLAPAAITCFRLDEEHPLLASTSDEPLAPSLDQDARPEDPAYVIYTSGTTGRPKGVVVPHRAVVNLLCSMAREPGLTAQDRLLAVTTVGFDIAVLELFLPLGVGGTVVIASRSEAADGRALAHLIDRERITVMQGTPSRWHLLLDSGWPGDARLKALVGGEPLAANLAARLLDGCAEVWNLYGPTETTVWSSGWRVNRDSLPAISLGNPVWNTTIQVLDAHGRPCPIGVTGEICIGGLGLALGYHGLGELTAERFVAARADQTDRSQRIYRTGDLGRRRHDGSLEHLGRLDDQIKIRGFRVEPGEIELRLLEHPAVARAVVVRREDRPGDARLVAYVVPDGAMPPREVLRQHLREKLPEHMIPGAIVEMAELPVLSNGKTDRRALPAPEPALGRSDDETIAPRDPTEQAIWAVWSEVLMTSDFGIHDDFFALGGHSLLAVRVVNRIEQRLKVPCPLRSLFEHPTVAELAAALGSSARANAVDIPVAVLQPHGNEPGLFLLAGAEMYRALAQRLGNRQPVYGVFSQTEIDLLQLPLDAATPDVRIESLAQEYLALIRSIQPHGPYYLGGISVGGVLAYEVAQHLRRQGEPIGLLIQLDSMLPGRGPGHLWAGVQRRLRKLSRDGLKHLLHLYRVYRLQSLQRHEPGSRRIRIYAEAIHRYKATPSALPLLFLQAGDDTSTAPAYGWRKLVPDLTLHRVPGGHMGILEPPNVDFLAEHVRAYLAAAQDPSARTPSMGLTKALVTSQDTAS